MALLHQVLKYDRNFSTSNSALYGTIKRCFHAKRTLFQAGNKLKWKTEMLNH